MRRLAVVICGIVFGSCADEMAQSGDVEPAERPPASAPAHAAEGTSREAAASSRDRTPEVAPTMPSLGILSSSEALWHERIAAEQAVAAADTPFAPRIERGAPVLETPGSTIARFDADGAHLAFGSRELSIRAVAVGREGAMRPLPAGASPVVAGPEVRTARGPGVVEWWRSLRSGLEHGVSIAERPAGPGELAVEIEVGGDLYPRLRSDDAVDVVDAAGTTIANYAHLVVLDASGARVPARIAMTGERVTFLIDDAGARYPLAIDPLLTAQEATLLASDGASGDQFGCSVALSSDGSRAIVAAYVDDNSSGVDAGSARIFLRTGATWMEEATLLAPDGVATDRFGAAVALSSDGSRALVGAYFDDTAGGSDAGSSRVFLRTGSAWAEEATLLASDGAGFDYLGWSVALSSDGSRALVGAFADDTAGGSAAGTARVFLRTGTVWAEEATLLAPDGAGGDYFGYSVALSSDGSRALVGAHFDDTAGGSDAGSARVFLRTGTAWAQEATLLAPDGATDDNFGHSVALSSDGSRALVGAYRDDTAGGSNAGSARVFLRSGTAWAQAATLRAPDGAVSDHLGFSVSLSSDGSRALVGAWEDDTAGGLDAGTARVFLGTGSVWAEEATVLAPDGAARDYFGYSVSLSSDGSRALVGAFYDDTAGGLDAGTARVFTILPAPNGSSCSMDAACASGFCTDGVCCSTRCAGGSTDCQACGAALTGGVDGTCAALSAVVAPTVTCRAATDVCDVPETCVATSNACPVDLFATVATVCRPSASPCDATDRCSGTSAPCPPDALATAGTVCRPPAGPCDVADACTGTSAGCPTDALAPSGTTCRPASAAGCDIAEVCDGALANCPGDGFAGAGTVCRSVMGACDVEERCAGGSPVCPVDVFVMAGLVCRPLVSACDAAETCSGIAPTCPPDLFEPATTVCGAAPSGLCDAPDHCAGDGSTCVDTYLSGVECRASSGSCDSPELCLGDAPSCPPDVVESAGMSCRASVDVVCDPEETCDGTSSVCPADINTCTPGDAGARDAGSGADASPDADGGPRVDTGVALDAGAPPIAASGCACRAHRVASPVPRVLACSLGVALACRRFRRRRFVPQVDDVLVVDSRCSRVLPCTTPQGLVRMRA